MEALGFGCADQRTSAVAMRSSMRVSRPWSSFVIAAVRSSTVISGGDDDGGLFPSPGIADTRLIGSLTLL